MKKEGFHLAQLNIARMKVNSIDEAEMAGFVSRSPKINKRAERSKGFVWRYEDSYKDSGVEAFQDHRILVNFSVWESLKDLQNFVIESTHLEAMKKRKEWFEPLGKPYLVMWFIPIGYTPTLQEAVERLEHLQENGASDYAFDFKYARKMSINQ